tara:strand:- start:2884 stop:4620 length:1737 start_codon:yes stop_codon:yes gene_type:complete
MSAMIKRRAVESIANMDLHPILQRIYAARGVKQPADLERDLKALLSYQTLMGVDAAASLLADSLTAQDRIVIIGDFDADGATSSALAMRVLKSFGVQQVSYLVPNRFDFGYGLTPEIVDVAIKDSPDLIITVDNGIANIAGVKHAKSRGIKVLITDHHLAADELPEADAIVNPNQPGDKFESKNLAGVGVIFYVMLALRQMLRDKDWFTQQNIPEPNMAEYLDLVALGTVADVVPLDKNNRILVHQGLRRIRAGKCCEGIKAILQVGKRKLPHVAASDLGFAVGPRLNAAGRLEDMALGIECLLTDDAQLAMGMAEELDALNQERKGIENDMRDQAFKALDKLKLDEDCLPAGITVMDETWHQGVIGILASRVKDKYHRPVIAFASADSTTLKGSARSIQGLHIRDVLDMIDKKNPGLIDKFGGHAMAAGLSLSKKNYATFQQAFAMVVGLQLNEDDFQQVIHSDGELPVTELNLQLAELLQQAGPWGQLFPEPLFDDEFELVDQRIVGQRHLKCTVKLGDKLLDAIAFNVDTQVWPNHRCNKIRAAYRLDVNEFRDIRTVQLIFQHIEAIPTCKNVK